VKAQEPRDFPWGLREVHLIDPAGVCWHFAEVEGRPRRRHVFEVSKAPSASPRERLPVRDLAAQSIAVLGLQ
jgi:hypothetical protein